MRNARVVDYAQLRRNAAVLKAQLPRGCRFCAVVKANAYGHGLIPAVQALEGVADWFAVATPEEALSCRSATKSPVLLLSPPDGEIGKLAGAEISVVVAGLPDIPRLAREAGRAGRRLKVHLAVDCGMHRLGLWRKEEWRRAADLLSAEPFLQVEGLMTHFCDDDPAFSAQNARRFAEAEGLFRARFPGILCHAAATSFADDPQKAFGMVRCGLALYGYGTALPVRPCLRFEAGVVCVRTVPAGETVGYGRTFCTERETELCVISAGYADGYPRALSNLGQAEINGKLCPVVGRVCMDLLTADATGAGARPGDRAVLYAPSRPELSLQRNADLAGTIVYELLTNLNNRSGLCPLPEGASL